MFEHSADLYDLIYDGFKDYRAEAVTLARLIREVRPEARSVLDVGCGTGRHAQHLTDDHGFRVDGIDLGPDFVDIAVGRCPSGRFEVADMETFDLGRSYDAVLCLFGSIGYLRTPERVRSACARMRAHLEPGGVALIEPWLEPGRFRAGVVHMKTGDAPDLKVCRMNRTRVEGRLSVLEFEYLVVSPDGFRRFSETHTLGLLTRPEMEAAIEGAGLELMAYDPEGFLDRGLYTARRA